MNMERTIVVPMESVQFISVEQMKDEEGNEVEMWAIVVWLNISFGDKPNFVKMGNYGSIATAKDDLLGMIIEVTKNIPLVATSGPRD